MADGDSRPEALDLSLAGECRLDALAATLWRCRVRACRQAR